jgi:hypothetical protein
MNCSSYLAQPIRTIEQAEADIAQARRLREKICERCGERAAGLFCGECRCCRQEQV